MFVHARSSICVNLLFDICEQENNCFNKLVMSCSRWRIVKQTKGFLVQLPDWWWKLIKIVIACIMHDIHQHMFSIRYVLDWNTNYKTLQDSYKTTLVLHILAWCFWRGLMDSQHVKMCWEHVYYQQKCMECCSKNVATHFRPFHRWVSMHIPDPHVDAGSRLALMDMTSWPHEFCSPFWCDVLRLLSL